MEAGVDFPVASQPGIDERIEDAFSLHGDDEFEVQDRNIETHFQDCSSEECSKKDLQEILQMHEGSNGGMMILSENLVKERQKCMWTDEEVTEEEIG